MSEYRFCIYCSADCFEDEPKHGPGCPTITGLYPTTNQDLEWGVTCMDCNTEFKDGDFYAIREIDENVHEVVCIGCRILNPEPQEVV